MQSVLLLVDKISTRVGQLAAWSIVALTLLIGWEVFSRYVLSNPHPWVMDASNVPTHCRRTAMCEVTSCMVSSSHAPRHFLI